jgi:RsmE family RNA methyltransferase
MNLLLLEPGDFIDAATVVLTGRRHRHLLDILAAGPGQQLRVGLLDGLSGTATVLAQNPQQTVLQVLLTAPPPPAAQITLLLALPRPKVLRRVLQGVATFGIKHIVLFNSARVDKSYWQSPLLSTEAIRDQLLLGLEQARDTCLPRVLLRPRFRPFVEDELSDIAATSLALLAHPEARQPCPSAVAGPVTLAIGPEGGFVPFEIDLLTRQGFQPVHLGCRPLRVESAIPALLGRLLPF